MPRDCHESAAQPTTKILQLAKTSLLGHHLPDSDPSSSDVIQSLTTATFFHHGLCRGLCRGLLICVLFFCLFLGQRP